MRELAERKGPEYCTAILGLYVFTGEDATSALKGKGKVGPLKKLHNHQTFYTTFRRRSLFVSRSTRSDLQVCYLQVAVYLQLAEAVKMRSKLIVSTLPRSPRVALIIIITIIIFINS